MYHSSKRHSEILDRPNCLIFTVTVLLLIVSIDSQLPIYVRTLPAGSVPSVYSSRRVLLGILPQRVFDMLPGCVPSLYQSMNQ